MNVTFTGVCCCRRWRRWWWRRRRMRLLPFKVTVRCTYIYICTVNNSMCSPETLAEGWSTVWLVLALRPHPRYCLVHSQYGGSSISMIDKLLCAGPNFPLEENAPHWFMPSGGAAHFPIILCFVSLFTARLHSPRPAAPGSSSSYLAFLH